MQITFGLTSFTNIPEIRALHQLKSNSSWRDRSYSHLSGEKNFFLTYCDLFNQLKSHWTTLNYLSIQSNVNWTMVAAKEHIPFLIETLWSNQRLSKWTSDAESFPIEYSKWWEKYPWIWNFVIKIGAKINSWIKANIILALCFPFYFHLICVFFLNLNMRHKSELTLSIGVKFIIFCYLDCFFLKQICRMAD